MSDNTTQILGYGETRIGTRNGQSGPTSASMTGPCCGGRDWPYSIIVDGQRNTLAIIPAQEGETEADADRRATLYAAAPDLVEALENFMGLYDSPVERRRRANDPLYPETISTGRTALAKARGEQS